MAAINLDEDSIDEILYLARANEASELNNFLSELVTQTKHTSADLVTAAVDSHSKNGALHYASANGHIDVIKEILSYGPDKVANPGLINAVNDAGNTPLHWGALNGHLQCVKLLVQWGADVTIINKAGHDAVFEAEINDKGEVVDWLLGAVEDLEKGIGQTGESSGNVDEEDGMATENKADENSSNGRDEANDATGVEVARRQMEGLKTNDGNSQGG